MDTITPNRPPFVWSYSALNNFETCAKKFYHTSIAKDFKEEKGEALLWGDKVHVAMANAVSHSSPLPPDMKQWEHWIKWAREPFDPVTTIMKAEERMALTVRMQPCDFFDKQKTVWFRTVADVLKVSGEYARVIDWKTGKSKTYLDHETNTWKTDSDQLFLAAAAIFIHYPMVKYIKMDHVWLQENFSTSDAISRDDMEQVWQRMLPRITKMRHAHYTGVYEPNPSGLCKRHCPVTSCKHHGVGNL